MIIWGCILESSWIHVSYFSVWSCLFVMIQNFWGHPIFLIKCRSNPKQSSFQILDWLKFPWDEVTTGPGLVFCSSKICASCFLLGCLFDLHCKDCEWSWILLAKTWIDLVKNQSNYPQWCISEQVNDVLSWHPGWVVRMPPRPACRLHGGIKPWWLMDKWMMRMICS